VCTSTSCPRIGLAIFISIAAVLLLCALAQAAETAPGSSDAAAAVTGTDTPAGAKAHATLLDIAQYFGKPTAKQRWMSLMFTLTRTGEWEEQQYLDQFVAALRSSNVGKDLSAPPVPTGDALFDRYAQALDLWIRTVKVKDITSLRAACLPDDLLASWERDFGGDPRYWELRYMCAYSSYHEGHPKSEDANPRKYLEEARRRGIATANTLLLLCGEERAMNESLLDQISQPRQWPGDAASHAQDEVRERYLRVSHEAEREELALLDAAVAKDPGCAWAYYERAMYCFDLGEQERGLADLEAGNAAPRNELPRPFPTSMVTRGMLASSPAGSAVVSGAVWIESVFQPYPSYVRWKDHLKESILVVDLSGDSRPLEAWHQFACRLAEAWPDTGINAVVGAVFADTVRSYMMDEQTDTLSAAQKETLAHVYGATDVARSIAVFDADPDWVRQALVCSFMIDGARGFSAAAYVSDETQARAVARVAEMMHDLSQVHYPALEMPDCLKKYEALTTEELQRRREARRAQRQADQPQ